MFILSSFSKSHKKFFKWLENELSIVHWEDWYKIKHIQLLQTKANGTTKSVLSLYGGLANTLKVHFNQQF